MNKGFRMSDFGFRVLYRRSGALSAPPAFAARSNAPTCLTGLKSPEIRNPTSEILLACLLCIPLLRAEDIPRPEYPQPQFQRELWINLNGRWEFAFDDANRGLEENWAA